VFDILIYLGAFQQRFGGNTAPVKTNTAKTFLFYDGGFKPKLGSPDRRYITAGAASENHYIVCHKEILDLRLLIADWRCEATRKGGK
jgi:hypothetical protein